MTAQTDLLASLPITDDDVNEADEQFFFVYLIISNAANSDLITITRVASICTIVDNDRKSMI